MELIIREAVESDANAIWQLNCLEMDYAFPLNTTTENLVSLLGSDSDRVYVAVLRRSGCWVHTRK